MASNEKAMPGGMMNRVVKSGDTVHRMVKGHPMLHSYLRYLEQAGMPGVPRFLGLDDAGREILTYLPGKTMGRDFSHLHPCLYSDETIADAARFMRRLHDASVGFVPRAVEGGWKNPYFPDEPPEVICHGDAAIWNFVFVDDHLAGLFDFDGAYPGTRMWDLTSTLFSIIPLAYFVYDPARRETVDYVPEKHAAERRRRIRLFFDAYGINRPIDIADLVADRIQRDFIDDVIRGAEAGEEHFIQMIRGGHLTHYRNIVAHLKVHGHEW